MSKELFRNLGSTTVTVYGGFFVWVICLVWGFFWQSEWKMDINKSRSELMAAPEKHGFPCSQDLAHLQKILLHQRDRDAHPDPHSHVLKHHPTLERVWRQHLTPQLHFEIQRAMGNSGELPWKGCVLPLAASSSCAWPVPHPVSHHFRYSWKATRTSMAGQSPGQLGWSEDALPGCP